MALYLAVLLLSLIGGAHTEAPPNCLAGVPGNPGHNGHNGRDGKDGSEGVPGLKGDRGEPGLCVNLSAQPGNSLRRFLLH